MFDKEKKARRRERDFYQKTQRKAVRRDLQNDIKKKPARRGMTPAWTYKAGAIGGSLGIGLGSIIALQCVMMTMANLGKEEAEKDRPVPLPTAYLQVSICLSCWW